MKQTRMRMAASTHWALTNGIVVYSTEKTEDKTSGETENGLAMAVGGWRSLWKSFAKKYSIASPNIMKMNKMKCQDEVGVYFYISLFASQLINENTFYRAWCNIWHHSRAIGRNKQYNKCLNGSKSMLMTSSDPMGINGRCGKQAALWVQRSHRLKDCKGGGLLFSRESTSFALCNVWTGAWLADCQRPICSTSCPCGRSATALLCDQ